MLRDADVVLFSHVGTGVRTSWGLTSGSGLVSVLYSFSGKAAHAAGRPWQGRSALDAVELMDIGWNFRREHLPLRQRSHSVIVDGGDQPNVVPQTASVWYYLRELDYKGIKELWAVADSVAEGAALMTGTTLLPTRVLGAAWPRHFNRPLARGDGGQHRAGRHAGLDRRTTRRSPARCSGRSASPIRDSRPRWIR